MMNKDAKIYLAGHTGLVGSALMRGLERHGYRKIITRRHGDLDLINQHETERFFAEEKPEYVLLAAARVGGIMANNTYRADFIYDNIQIQNNVIHFSWKYGVNKLLFLGSSCIYPKNAPQPLKEEYLLSSELEYTNEPYAIAKIAGIKMCEAYNIQHGTNFLSVMPTNLYGPGDNYDLEKSHVLPALIRKFHLGKCLENNDWEGIRRDFDKRPVEGISGKHPENEISGILSRYGIAKSPKGVEITFWGTGKPMREFLHSDDLAEACIFILKSINFSQLTPETREIRNTHLNIGTGLDISIIGLADMIGRIAGFSGTVAWDDTKPVGTLRKVMDVTRMAQMNWHASVSLEEGLERVFNQYVNE